MLSIHLLQFILQCFARLSELEITSQHLKDTNIDRTVDIVRKREKNFFLGNQVLDEGRKLINKWNANIYTSPEWELSESEDEEVAQEIIQDAAQETPRDPAQETPQDAAQETPHDATQEVKSECEPALPPSFTRDLMLLKQELLDCTNPEVCLKKSFTVLCITLINLLLLFQTILQLFYELDDMLITYKDLEDTLPK